MNNIELHSLFSECLDRSYVNSSLSASYDIEQRGDLLRIFFEASNGKEDWNNNLDFLPDDSLPDFRGPYHRGFLRVFESIRPVIEKMLDDTSIHRVLTVGYSHGAALAFFCHGTVWIRRPDLRETLTTFAFGAPRVFYGTPGRKHRRIFARYYRIVNEGDIVTGLPPAILGYSHVGKEIRIGTVGKYSPIDAHRPENYQTELLLFKGQLPEG